MKEWVTNIILFVLLATVIDLLLPNTAFIKYVKLVMGLLLIAIVITPVFKLLDTDFETLIESIPSIEGEVEKKMENSLEMQKKEIQASQHAYILEETASMLRESAEEELMEKYGLQIEKIELEMDAKNGVSPDNLTKITVFLKKQEENEETETAVAKVEKIIIDTSSPPSDQITLKDSGEIAAFLAAKWGVEEKKVEIVGEGGAR